MGNTFDAGYSKFAEILALPSCVSAIHVSGKSLYLFLDEIGHENGAQNLQLMGILSCDIVYVMKRIEMSLVYEKQGVARDVWYENLGRVLQFCLYFVDGTIPFVWTFLCNMSIGQNFFLAL